MLWLESDQDVVAWTSQIDNLSEDFGFIVGKRFQSAKLLIPSITDVSHFRSSLVVANLDPSAATVEFRFRDGEGNLQASVVETIPRKGFLSTPDILRRLGISERYGPLEIVSLEGKPIVALSTVSSLQRTAGTFEGVP
jgi:hypothetical protein